MRIDLHLDSFHVVVPLAVSLLCDMPPVLTSSGPTKASRSTIMLWRKAQNVASSTSASRKRCSNDSCTSTDASFFAWVRIKSVATSAIVPEYHEECST